MRIDSLMFAPDKNMDERAVGGSADLRRAAQQFEAIMIKQFLKPFASSAASGAGADRTDEGQADALGDFAVNALAEQISKSGGMGIANFIVKAEYGKNNCLLKHKSDQSGSAGRTILTES